MPKMRARRSAAAGHGSNGSKTPFHTLLDLQDALRSKSVYVLDSTESSYPSSSSAGIGNPAHHVPPGAGASSRGEDAGTTTAGTAAGIPSPASSSSHIRAASAAVDDGSITSAVNLAGGRGYTAEAWEPTRLRMISEQHALAARLRAVLEDALQQEQQEEQEQEQEQQSQRQSRESGSDKQSQDNGELPQQPQQQPQQQPRPTILHRHAHTVLQLLGVTEAIAGGYVLDDYAAPYLSGLAQRQYRQDVALDGAVQTLRKHRAELKRETEEAADVEGAAAAAAEQDTVMADTTDVEAEGAMKEAEKESDEEWTPGQRVTANEYAKIYLTSGRGRSRSRSTERKKRRTKKGAKKKKRSDRSRSGKRSRDGTPEADSSGDEVLATYQSKKGKKKQKMATTLVDLTTPDSLQEDDGGEGGGGWEYQPKKGWIPRSSKARKTEEWNSILQKMRQQESTAQEQEQEQEQDDAFAKARKELLEIEAEAETTTEDEAQQHEQGTPRDASAIGKKKSGPADSVVDRDVIPYVPGQHPPGEAMARYICDFCHVAEFLDYDEACRHEETCAKRAKPTEPPPEFEPPRSVRTDRSPEFGHSRPSVKSPPPSPLEVEQSTESEGESLDTKKPPASVAEAAAAVVAEVVAEAKAAGAAAAAASWSKPLPRHNLFAPSSSREDSPPAAPMQKDLSAMSAIRKPRRTREPRRKPTKCHHCRNTTNQFRRCSYWNANGRQCRLGYCQRCLEDIYDHTTQHGPWDQCLSDKEWHCPSCQDSCQCQPCAIRRKKEEKRTSKVGDRERRSRRGN